MNNSLPNVFSANQKHPNYYKIKARGPDKKFPAGTALLRYWEHMENVHGASPEDFGTKVLTWHEKNHPDCTTLPSYEEARQVS